MSNLSLDEVIDIAGGPVTANNLPAVIPPPHFISIVSSIRDIGQRLDRILSQYGQDKWGAIALTNSTTYGCQIRPIEDEGFAVLVPVGMLARIRVLARILLTYWKVESAPRFMRSPLDNVPVDRDAIPPLLKPLLLDEDDSDFWDRLLELDQTVSLEALAENDVQELLHVALVFILSHEFAHLLHGHFDLLRRAETENLPLTMAEIRRGIELDADDGGTAVAMKILSEAIDEAKSRNENVELELAWLRLAYAVTMIFAISDTHRMYFGSYDKDAYNHPMVRCELFFASAGKCLDLSDSIMEIWKVNSAEGWKRCLLALENLTLDAWSGKFGEIAEGKEPSIIHTLTYSITPYGATDMETLRKCRAGSKLMWEVRKLLPIFADAVSNLPEDMDAMTGESLFGEVRAVGIDSEPVIGVYGLTSESIEALQHCFGESSVVIYSAPELPEDLEDLEEQERLVFVAENNRQQAMFFESVNHMILILGDVESFVFFTGSMIQVQQNRMATVTCIVDSELEDLWRKQMQNMSEVAGEPTAEEWEEQGKLSFLREFDLSAVRSQIASEREFRRNRAN